MIKNLGKVKEYLGINVECDYRNYDMKLCQQFFRKVDFFYSFLHPQT